MDYFESIQDSIEYIEIYISGPVKNFKNKESML